MGGVILAVDIGVLFWNIHVLRAYRIRPGIVIAVFLVVAIVAMITSAFAGIEPLATYAERVTGWFPGAFVASDAPYGTYVATVWGIEQSMTFRRTTVEFYDVIEGKRVLEYSISEDGNSITLKNVATGETHTTSFRYIKEHGIVVYGEFQYHRR